MAEAAVTARSGGPGGAGPAEAPAGAAARAAADAPDAPVAPDGPHEEGTGEPALEPGPEIGALRFRRHRAYLIGIDDYQFVTPLRTAVADASWLGRLLEVQHHFEVHPPLLNATGAEIRALMKTMAEEVGANDRVLFYFAGHGIAADGIEIDGEVRPAGFLVPADAKTDKVETLVPMADLQAVLDALPCRHLMLILDCCFSGAFKWSGSHRATSGLMPKRIYKERFDRFLVDPARQVLTSAAHDQKALDVLEGKATGERGAVRAGDGRDHSPFANALFEALSGMADLRSAGEGEGDGVLTATEIYGYVRDRIEPATLQIGQRQRQTPNFFPLPQHASGEFLFLHPRHRLNLDPAPKRSPYKGLEAFDEADALLFYGRDRVIAALAERLADPGQRLLVVSGPSGTGKSSVIKAGLLPRLRKEGRAILPPMRPGEQPLDALQQAVQAALPFVDADGRGRAVLLIDQYEELITRCADPTQRSAFEARLHALLQAPGPLDRVIVTVRSDFEPQLAAGPLKTAWLKGKTTVPPFNLEELREVIVLPALQEVLVFEPPSLVDQIIDDVIQSPGVLPLLSFALNELYEASQGKGRQRVLAREDYEAMGGAMGALRRKADALYEELEKAGLGGTMRRLMLRMVSVEGELAGRRVVQADLDFPQGGQAAVEKVVERLVDARLVMSDKGAIEPAHDAMVRAWGAMHRWVNEVGRGQLILVDKLAADLKQWRASAVPDPGHLWHDNPNLAVVRKALQSPDHVFTRAEVDFIDASVRRKTRRLRMAIGTTAAVIAMLAGLMTWGWLEQRRAVATIGEARNLSDDLMFKVVDELGRIDNTQAVREALADRVGQLQEKLSAAGAGDDRSTRFWQSVMKGDFAVEMHRKAHGGSQAPDDPAAKAPEDPLAVAQQSYLQAMAIALGLPDGSPVPNRPVEGSVVAALDPNWQRNVSVAYGKLAQEALDALGSADDPAARFEEKRKWLEESLAIDERLAQLDPRSQAIQNDLRVSRIDMGLMFFKHYDRTADPEAAKDASDHLRSALLLAQSRLKDEPNDGVALRQAFRSLHKLGMLAIYLAETALRDDEARQAAKMFGDALALAEQHREQVLEHAGLQLELAEAYNMMADLHWTHGRLEASLDAALRAVDRARPAALDDPGNSDWRTTYMNSQNRLLRAAVQIGDGATLSRYESARDDAVKALARLPDDPHWSRWAQRLESELSVLPDLLKLLDRAALRQGCVQAVKNPMDDGFCWRKVNQE